MFHLDQIELQNKVTDGDFTMVVKSDNKEINGNIYLTENCTLISKSFGNTEEVIYEEESFKNFVTSQGGKGYFTPCYEGPLIRICHHNDELIFSNYNKINCRNSFYGNKEDKFEKLFFENGGQKFIESLTEESKKAGYSHHFMIVNRDLLITSRLDMRDNETIVVYLGTTTLDGKILDIALIDNNVHFYNYDPMNLLPIKEELKSRILLPTKISSEQAFNLLIKGYESLQYDSCLSREITNGECVIFRNGVDKIVKFFPKNYEIRSYIAGKTPNKKHRLYNLLEESKKIDIYFDTFPVVGCLNDSELELIKENKKTITTFQVHSFLNKGIKFEKSSYECRMKNIVTLCILCCPLTKIDTYINSWFDYNSSRDKIIQFIKKHNSAIRNGGYDEKLLEFHSKASERIKALATVSKNYANDNRNGYNYNSRMLYSLKGLLRNEFGPSLYRIEKAISYIQE